MAMRDDSAIGVIDAIRRDHREIEEMLAEVEGAKGQSREEAFAALAQKLKAHESAEQEVVHPITDEVGATDVADSVEKEESTASQLLTPRWKTWTCRRTSSRRSSKNSSPV